MCGHLVRLTGFLENPFLGCLYFSSPFSVLCFYIYLIAYFFFVGFVMFENFMPGLSTFTVVAVVLSVVVSELVLRFIDGFNHKHECHLLMGTRFLVPLVVGCLFALIQVRSEGLSLSYFFREAVIIYGYSTVLFEAVAKRIFGAVSLKLGSSDGVVPPPSSEKSPRVDVDVTVSSCDGGCGK